MLRCGCFPEVETGRYRAPKTEDLWNGVGDETHFVNHCQPLATLRLHVQLYEVVSDACDFNFYALPPEQKTPLILNLCAENAAAPCPPHVTLQKKKTKKEENNKNNTQ